MHSDLKTVIDLQHVDSKIAELTARIDALPIQIKTLEDRLKDYLHAHEERKLRLVANQKERRELEGEIQLIQTKISKHKGQLYEVKTNEQYKALVKEIEGEEGNIRKIEDKILEKMVEAEESQKMVNQAAASLEGEKERVAAESKHLNSLREADVKERDTFIARRKELTAGLDSHLLETYERVRRGRKGIAVAEVRDGFCTACNVRLRPQVYNEIRTNDTIQFCESCSRFMFCVEPAQEVSEQVAKAADAGGRETARD
ncbi:MAG TPA: C4-type zinc ribbon domain-containing protein [Terriglobia bacterium]|nr:C4-type zinc ribbon domain-containing protein [Terriglobia bacterium]